MVGRPKKSEQPQPTEEINTTRSGRKIIRPGEATTTPTPVTTTNKKKSNKSKDSDEEQEQKSILENKKTAATATPSKRGRKKKPVESSSEDEEIVEEVVEEIVEEVIEKPKTTKRRGKAAVSQSTEASGSNVITKKYTQAELNQIQAENRIVYIKFFFFSFLMVLVPIVAFKLVNTTVGDYLGINRVDRVSYAGFASLGGLISVVAAYSIMAYYEK